MGKNGGRPFHGAQGGGNSSNDTSSCRGHGAVMGTCDAARERETSKELVNLLNQAIEELEPKADDDDEKSPDGGSSIQDMLALELQQVRNQSHSATQNVMSVNTKIKGVVLIKIMRQDLCPVKLVRTIFERVRREKQPVCRHVVRIIPLQRIFFPDEKEVAENVQHIVSLALPGVKLPTPPVLAEVTSSDDKVEKAPKETEKDVQVGEKRTIDQAAISDATPASSEDANKKACTLEAVADIENDQLVASSVTISTTVIDVPDTNIEEIKKIPVPATNTAPSSSSSSSSNSASHSSTKPPQEPSQLAKYGPFVYSISFKARNHNVLNREKVFETIKSSMPPFSRPSYKDSNATFVVEALRNICGATLLRPGYEDYEEFNLRKFQAKHTKKSNADSSLLVHAPLAATAAVAVNVTAATGATEVGAEEEDHSDDKKQEAGDEVVGDDVADDEQ